MMGARPERSDTLAGQRIAGSMIAKRMLSGGVHRNDVTVRRCAFDLMLLGICPIRGLAVQRFNDGVDEIPSSRLPVRERGSHRHAAREWVPDGSQRERAIAWKRQRLPDSAKKRNHEYSIASPC